MKIGIDCREIRSYITGIGRILIEFFREAKGHSKDFNFILFGNQYTDFLSFQDVFKDYKKVIIKEKLTLWWDQIQLKKAIEKYHIDVFFSPYYKIPLLTKTRTVLSIFDVTYLLVKPYKNYLMNRLYIRNFVKFASKRTEKILTCSNHTKNDLCKITNLPEDKIKVVYLGVSPGFNLIHGRSEIELVKEKYGIRKKYILYVGNFKPHKNVRRLVEVYDSFPYKMKKEYALVLVGGEYLELGLGNSRSAICIKHTSDKNLSALYSGAELFVFPSLYEGFGFPPLEAMASGCPVVSSNTSSLPEVLGDAALLFNPYDTEEMSSAVRKMLEDENLRNRFCQKGLERAKIFTPQKMTKEILSLLESIPYL